MKLIVSTTPFLLSDGDGQTNGQELGDSCCEWVYNTSTTVRWTVGISHPGDDSKTSDPKLWANITCTSNSATNTTNGTSSANTTSTTTPQPTATQLLSSAATQWGSNAAMS